LRAQREAELSGDPSLRRVARTDTAIELGLCRAVDLVVAVSPDEAALMRSSIDDEVRIEVLPNIHQSEQVPEGCAHRTGVVFVGGYRHTPNVDAALWMTGEILPLLEPDVTLTLAGSYVVPEVSVLANDRVVVPGWIDDLTPLYDSARVVVAPLRYGAGVKGKIGEALAHGVPVVTTSIGAEGMHLVHGENALIADTPQAFAAAVNQLIHDDELWLRLSSAGRAHVAHHFGPEAAERSLRRIIEAVGINLPGASD
jgi:glycosyltransferase involved in cell wall biosynthesis